MLALWQASKHCNKNINVNIVPSSSFSLDMSNDQRQGNVSAQNSENGYEYSLNDFSVKKLRL